MTAAASAPSPRALAVAEGLVRTGRGAERRRAGKYLRLTAAAGGFYWVTIDGSRLLRGDDLDSADELQAPFVEAMVRAGTQQ